MLLPDLITMSTTLTRHYQRISEYKRIQIIALREQQYTLEEVSKKTKVKKETVREVLRKWEQHHTIKDLPKTGRPAIVDDRTKRRLASIAQSGEVGTAPELALADTSHASKGLKLCIW